MSNEEFKDRMLHYFSEYDEVKNGYYTIYMDLSTSVSDQFHLVIVNNTTKLSHSYDIYKDEALSTVLTLEEITHKLIEMTKIYENII